MRNFLFIAFTMIISLGNLFAQAPQKFNYQAIARDSSGNLFTNQNVSFRISVLKDSASGTVVYMETHQITTNTYGLATIAIGSGTVVLGNFLTIDWGNDSYYLQTEMDTSGGISYVLLGISQFLSVPYALYAQSSGSTSPGNNPGDMLYWNGTTWEIAPAGQYGQQLFFYSGVPVWGGCAPLLTTEPVTEITFFSSTCGGNITSVGGSPITACGVCWSTSANPTTANNHNINDNGTGLFVSNLNGLDPNTLYHVRAYATNSLGTTYGNEETFTTLINQGLPSVNTTAATVISQTTAISGGDVTSGGGTTVLFRGLCWGISPNPSIANDYTTDGSGTGVFVSNLTNLTENTLYYVRAFAINLSGTIYGNEVILATLPTVTTTTITSVTQTTATCGGNVATGGGAAINSRGVCWSTIANPSIADNHTTDGSSTGTFTSNLTGLTGNTVYYIRAYANNGFGVSYGNQQSFTTSPLIPIVTTTSVTPIALTTATSGGNVTSNGGANVTIRGVCWSTSANPTTANSKTIDGSGSGVFVSNLTELSENTYYYMRAYATNSLGTAYGNEITFTTLLSPIIPTVTTAGITNITANTASSGGNVLSDGGANVIFRGICWSTNQNPTILDSHTTDGNGTGIFVSNLTGITLATLYYIRAYALNSVGTAYGNEVSFTPLEIGQSYQGGIIFYLDGIGQHGLIASTNDQGSAAWGCVDTFIGTSTAIGTGQTNTTAILNGCGQAGIAARICDNLELNGYSDWFLPSSGELGMMHQQKTVIGGFNDGEYWCSSEDGNWIEEARIRSFLYGAETSYLKSYSGSVRAIRAF